MDRVRIFIDFWNFQLSLNQYHPDYRLDWGKLPDVLARASVRPGGSCRYEGTIVFASFDPNRPQDRRLRHWLLNTLDAFPGFQVFLCERKPARAPHCPNCDRDILMCPHCEAVLRRSVEKGVDTGLVTCMLQHAWDDTFDVGVLVSNDRDFIPAVEFLDRRGKKIVHAGFPPNGRELANACWMQVDIRRVLGELKR